MSTPQNPGQDPFDENDGRPGPRDYNRDYTHNPYSSPDTPSYPAYGQSPFEAPGYGGDQPGYPTNNYGGPNYGTPMANPTLMGFGAPDAAGPWRRLGAYLVDSLVVGLISSILTSFFLSTPLAPQTEADMDRFIAEMVEYGGQVAVVTAVIFFVYATILQTTNFSTLGKRALGIRVTDMERSPLTLGRSALRNAWLLLSAVPFVSWLVTIIGLVIFIMAFAGDRTQGLNDKWAQTRVVKRQALGY